jgi:diadenosine tetraphosphatase ApaH/serine/threonine PP2A family protein phosphatase
MKYAVLADIHANLAALQTVLADIDGREKVDEIWCLGDVVGYGPDPHRCIEIIQNRCSVCVAGNHDWAAIGKMDTAAFNPEAAEAAEWTSRQLKSEDVRFLASLPLIREKGNFTLTHGSPRDPIWEYILTAAEVEENLKYFQTPYCFIGHSHQPLWYDCQQTCTGYDLLPGTVIKLGQNRSIINPGSVGQPRDGDPRAGYAIYDDTAQTVVLHRLGYDIKSTQEKMQDAGLPEWLILRLAQGR